MRIFRIPPRDFDLELLREPAEILRSGGLVAFPTETVYGLGASSRHEEAAQRLARLKSRPEGKPFSYHLARVEQVDELDVRVPRAARVLLERYCPGPLTLVIPKAGEAPGGTIGVRIPANEIARQLIELVGVPLLVPSANPADQPPALSAEDVLRYFSEDLDAVVDGGEVLLKEASTVVRVDDEGYEVLREGIITREMIHQLLEGKRVLFVCTGNTCRSPMAAEIFKKHLAERLGKAPDELQELGYRVQSAGTFALRGGRPTDHAVTVLKEAGMDASHHVTQPLTRDILAGTDHVYALSRSHFQFVEGLLEELEPSERPRLDMLREDGVVDPVGGDLETYRQCLRDIEEAILGILPR